MSKCTLTLELDQKQLEMFKSILAVTMATTMHEVKALEKALKEKGERRLLETQKPAVMDYLSNALAEQELITGIIKELNPAIEKFQKENTNAGDNKIIQTSSFKI